MDINLEEMTEYISKFIDYIIQCVPNGLEKDNAITRLEEAVFWITYLNEE